MNYFFLLLSIICIYLPNAHAIYGDIYSPPKLSARFAGMTWQINGTMYIMGGESYVMPVYSVDRLSFAPNNSIVYDTPIRNTNISCIYCYSLLLNDNRNVIIFDTLFPWEAGIPQIKVYQYDTLTNTITDITPVNNSMYTTSFASRAISQLTSKDAVYVFGQSNILRQIATWDILRVDVSTLKITNMSTIAPYPVFEYIDGCSVTLP